MSLLPHRPETSSSHEDEYRIVLDNEDLDDILDVIQADTARQILVSVYNDPKPASEIADDVGTSVQNVTYHLEKLNEADLIEHADTWYSEKGNQMTVYAPVYESVVLVLGTASTPDSLQDAAARALGILSVFASVAFGLSQSVRSPQAPSTMSTSTATDLSSTVINVALPTVQSVSVPAEIALPLVFLLGGVLALLLRFGIMYWQRR